MVSQLLKKVICTDEEREEMIPLIADMIDLSERSRRCGLLSLEEDIPEFESEFMRKGLQLVTDGTDHELVNDILIKDIIACNYSGKLLLMHLIMHQGILLIQEGQKLNILADKLFSMINIDYETRFPGGAGSFVSHRSYNSGIQDIITVGEVIAVKDENGKFILSKKTTSHLKQKFINSKSILPGYGVVANDNQIIADMNGHIRITGNTINIDCTFVIARNVSLEDGDVVGFKGTIYIRGDIEAGCSVKADGDIFITGKNYSDKVEAGGDIFENYRYTEK